MNRRLLVQLYPYEGESLRGFLLRLSGENLLPSSTWIVDAPEEVRQLRKYIGSLLHGRIPIWLRIAGDSPCSTNKLNEKHILGARARFCPECFAEKPYWRLHWEHALYTVCHQHGCLLVERCPQCSKELTWDRSQLGYCDCTSRLSTWPREKRPEIERHLCLRLARCIAADAGISFKIDENVWKILSDQISTAEITALIFVFGGYGEMQITPPKQGPYSLTNLKVTHNLVRVTAQLLEDWPSRFLTFFRETGKYGLPDAHKQEPPIHFVTFGKILRARFASPALEFVLEEYRRFMTENWRGVLNSRNTWANSDDFQDQRYMPAKLVARHLRITYKRVTELVQKNILHGYITHTAQGRVFVVVDRNSIPNAEAYFNDQMTLAGAGILLGLPTRRVDELVTAGYLTSMPEPRTGNRLLSRQEIATFIKRLSCCTREPVEDDLLTIHTLLKVHLATQEEFTAFISAIIKGMISPIANSLTERGLAGFAFERKEFYKWRSALRMKFEINGITVTDAAIRLSVKQEVAYHLVHTGLLPSAINILGKKKCRLIRQADIEDFQATYVSITHLARFKKTSPKALINFLTSVGIQPIAGPGVNGCRQYFFRRADIPIEYRNCLSS